MNLGEQIYKLRTARNLSQGDLAEQLEVSRQSVSKWENNSAVPELDKLLKMAQMFGITLDELVSRQEAPPAAPAPEPAPEPFAPPQPILVSAQLPTQKILGLVLICLGALAVILGLALPELQREASELLVLLGSCGITWGIICLCLRYPQLYCGWSTWVGYLIYTFVLTPRWEEQTPQLVLAGVLLVIMLVWTVGAIRKEKVHIPTAVLIMGGLVLVCLVALFFINTAPPFKMPVEQRPAEIIPPVSSKVP